MTRQTDLQPTPRTVDVEKVVDSLTEAQRAFARALGATLAERWDVEQSAATVASATDGAAAI